MDRSIENLFIWNESRIFVNAIYKMMATCKDYGFRDQIQRAAVSIMNNIAEGSESGSDAKFINFLNIAKGSCGEVRSMLYLCEDFNFCSPEQRVELQSQLKKISTGIVRLQDSLNAKSTRL
ncbi:MAG: four helix bundle protein [Bacteroidales bacterium]|nr:four helix bundle protein [Bacteroidales bacterium]